MADPSTLRLAVLDDYAGLAQKAFSEAGLSNLEITVFRDTIDPKTPEGLTALTSRLQPFHIISTMRERTPFPATLLSALRNLKLLLTTGTRNASIDLAAARQHNIIVTGTNPRPSDPNSTSLNPPPPTHDSTTQHALSLLLSLTSRIPLDNARLASDPQAWQSGLTIPLYGKTLGVLGLGKLGTNFARLCVTALGMRVLAWSPNLTQSRADDAAIGAGLPPGTFTAVSKEDLLRKVDVLSLHLVLSERSRGIIGGEELAMLKPTALLVNTARAGLVDEDALLDVLKEGKIRGAAMDVHWTEPLPAESVWRTTRWGEESRAMVVLSPHMGYVNEETMGWWYVEQAREVGRWLRGEEVQNRLG